MYKNKTSGSAATVCRHHFNMIEVVLGMGLIAFGLLSTLGLFPAGLNAGRDSVAESYAANSADQFLHYFAARLKNSANNNQNWTSFGKALPTSKPSGNEPSNWTEWFTDGSTVFWYGGSNREYYKVEQKAPGAVSADFAAIYRVWRTNVTYAEYVDGSWQQTQASADTAIGINVEVSWPLNIPYQRRGKALYHLEVYRPQ